LNYDNQCNTHTDSLSADINYKLLIRVQDDNDEQAGAGRRLLATEDYGFSWDQLLRYRNVAFSSGGTFKLCFCDSEVLPKGKMCSTKEDYAIFVGTVHASGVSCLIADSKLQRAACASQYYGGYRCYRDMPAPQLTLPTMKETYYAPTGDETMTLTTFCALLPAEEAHTDPRCSLLDAHHT